MDSSRVENDAVTRLTRTRWTSQQRRGRREDLAPEEPDPRHPSALRHSDPVYAVASQHWVHAEQTRWWILYDFLMANSILILAWATIYTAKSSSPALYVLSLAGGVHRRCTAPSPPINCNVLSAATSFSCRSSSGSILGEKPRSLILLSVYTALDRLEKVLHATHVKA